MGFALDEWMVAWTPRKAVEVGPWPDRTGWSDKYSFTSGCCMCEYHDADIVTKALMVFIDFHTLTVRDGINPQAAHLEFLKIDEYRKRISLDIKGAN